MDQLSILPTERTILQSSQTKRIKDCSQAELKGAILYVMLLIGVPKERIKSFSLTTEGKTTEQMKIMISAILKGFPLMRIQDISTAFDLAIQGKFEAETSLYNRDFNFQYVGLVLREYNKYKQPILKKTLNKLSMPKEMTPQQKHDKTIAAIKQYFADYEATKKMPKNSQWIYQYLEKIGEINHDIEFKTAFLKPAEAILTLRLTERKLTADVNQQREITKQLANLNKQFEIKSIGRELALQYHWDMVLNSED